ncbi:MAG: OmpA family protein [Geminicoccaceae bacterium]
MVTGAKRGVVVALAVLAAACDPFDAPQTLDVGALPISGNRDAHDEIDFWIWDLDAAHKMAPHGPAFSQGLRVEYLQLSDAENSSFDFRDYRHFARKAVASASAQNVLPDAVNSRNIDEPFVLELQQAYFRLNDALEETARKKAPLQSAKAQASFDCWLEQQEENAQPDDIAACKDSFLTAMARVDDALASSVDNVYVVFFAFDQATITPVAERILDEAIADFAEGEAVRVILAGHADTAGDARYNDFLSEQRARIVADYLSRSGVDNEQIFVTWFGETQPRVATADGVLEPQNRRVELSFE